MKTQMSLTNGAFSQAHSMRACADITFLCFCPEVGVSFRSLELDRVNPGSAGSEFGERPVPFFELQTLAGSEFGERTRSNPGLAGSKSRERPAPFS